MGRKTDVQERELKFDASMEVALPDLRPLVGRTVRIPQQDLDTVYFDSLDGRLWERGLTLRHRTTEGDDAGEWTLKTPADSDVVLGRTELSWCGPRTAVPSNVKAILRGVLRREPLRQVVRLDTVRQRLILRDDQDATVAELDDDRVTVTGGPRDGTRFRQVELELREGGHWCSRPVIARLERAGFSSEPTPKFARAMGLGGHDARRRAERRPWSLVEVVQARISDGFERIVDHDWRLRAAAPDLPAEDVHQARVATRRLRSDLKTFGDVLDPVWVKHVRRDLKWLGAALGDVRDADVLGATLPGLPAQLGDVLAGQRLAAARRVASAMDDTRYLRLLDRLHAATTCVPIAGGTSAVRATESGRDELPQLVEARWRALRRKADKARRRLSPERLHQVRIKAKDVRYASETAALVLGEPPRRLAKAAKRVQTELGGYHDAVVGERWLRQTVAESSQVAGASFEAGALAGELLRRQHHDERNWRCSWKALAKPRNRRWLS